MGKAISLKLRRLCIKNQVLMLYPMLYQIDKIDPLPAKQVLPKAKIGSHEMKLIETLHFALMNFFT